MFKGGGDFRPTTLASHRAMLHEAEQLDGHMAEMELAAKLFQHASECEISHTLLPAFLLKQTLACLGHTQPLSLHMG